MNKFSIISIAIAGLLLAPWFLKRGKQKANKDEKYMPQKRDAAQTNHNSHQNRNTQSSIIRVSVALNHPGKSNLRNEKIAEADIPFIQKLELRDWNGKEFDVEYLLKWSTWISNPTKTRILIGLGGGCFEIPKMYDAIFHGTKIRVHVGGGSERAMSFMQLPDQSQAITIHVTQIQIPAKLERDQDAILEFIAEALAISEFGSETETQLVVEFKL